DEGDALAIEFVRWPARVDRRVGGDPCRRQPATVGVAIEVGARSDLRIHARDVEPQAPISGVAWIGAGAAGVRAWLCDAAGAEGGVAVGWLDPRLAIHTNLTQVIVARCAPSCAHRDIRPRRACKAATPG